MPLLRETSSTYVTPAREKLKNSSKRRPCPICNGTGCGVNSQIVLCWRVEAGSKERVKSGAYLHLRGDFNPFIPQVIKPMDPKASPELIAKVYDSFLDCLVLEDRHVKELLARGLPEHVIQKNRYRSTPSKQDGQFVCKYLGDLYDLDYVPGFYLDESRRINVKGSGIFIPYRNVDGAIRAMQIRPNRGETKYFWFSSTDLYRGASSGSFVHFSRPNVARAKKEIYITEGGLKGDCIASLGSAGVASIAGVNAVDYDTLVNEIKTGLPEVEKVILAFDADWKSNPHVKEALLRLSATASKVFKVEIEDWDIKRGKGLDDKLLKDKNNKRILTA